MCSGMRRVSCLGWGSGVLQGCCRCPGVSRVEEDLAPKRLIEECFDCHCLFPALRGAHCVYRMCVSEREALSLCDCTRYTHT